MKNFILFFTILFPVITLGRFSDGKVIRDDQFLFASPKITVSVASLPPFTSCIQTTSNSQNFTVSGSFLTAGITISTTAGFEISHDNINFGNIFSFTEVSGNVPSSTVYVRMAPTTSPISGIITITSTGAVSKTVTILGAVDITTTWNGSSWNPLTPTSTMMAVIAGNYSQSQDINACYLKITNGAIATIPSGYNVILGGALTVDFGSFFTLENNAGLIQSGSNNINSGTITVKRNSSFLKRLDYTFWGSPTFGAQSLQDFSVATAANRFYEYNTYTNLFSVVPNPSATNFATARGYIIRTPIDHSLTGAIWTGQFSGKPNSGTIMVNLNNFGPGFRYNLVANPYPSPINATAFVQANSANIEGTLYFWRMTSGGQTDAYCTWSTAGFVTNGDPQSQDPNGIIQTAQGFIVEAKNAATTLVFNNSMRSDTNVDQFFKSSNPTEYNRIWLNATSSEGLFSQTLIAYVTDGSDNLDASDAKSINDGRISLTSLIAMVPHTIQGRSLPFHSDDVVELQFKAKNAGNFSIAIDHFDGFFAGTQEIFLKDNQTGIFHDLKMSPYYFASEAGTFKNRFSIVYQNVLLVDNPDFDSNSVLLYKNQNNIVVNSGNIHLDNVVIFDIRGRILAYAKNINTTEVAMNVGQMNQVLIVKITSIDGSIVTKKIIN